MSRQAAFGRVALFLFVALILTALAKCDDEQERSRMTIIYSGLALGDIASTRFAMSRGATERLLPLKTFEGASVLRLAGAGLCIWGDRQLIKHNSKMRWPLRIAVLSLQSYAVLHNLRAARGNSRRAK